MSTFCGEFSGGSQEKFSIQTTLPCISVTLKNGSSAIEELDVDAYGNIRNWPTDFFGDEMGELADMTVAAMERQKAGRQ